MTIFELIITSSVDADTTDDNTHVDEKILFRNDIDSNTVNRDKLNKYVIYIFNE